MIIQTNQISLMGSKNYVTRMRQYLNEQFPESIEVEKSELENVILELTERAAGYKLTLETQVAPFIVAAWIMGVEFDHNFVAAKEVLENLDMDSNEKSNWLWNFLEETIGILEDSK